MPFKSHLRATTCKAGVTLVELLVASVIVSICLLGACQAARSCLQASEHVNQSRHKGEQLRRAFDLVARDLRCAIVEKLEDRSMVFEGRGDGEQAMLSFITLPGDANTWRVGARSSLRRITYSQEGDEWVRSEVPLTGPGASFSGALVEEIEHVSFRFVRGQESLDRWDSDTDLPEAVQVMIAADAGTYRTMVRIPGAKGPEESREGDL